MSFTPSSERYMKLTASMVLAPLRHVLEDAVKWKPELKTSFSSSLDRLERILDTRGPGIVLLDFVEAGKLFDSSLSRGLFYHEQLPKSLGSFASRRTLFYDLFLTVMDDQGRVDDPADEDAVFFCRQVLYLFKKLKVDCPEAATVGALHEFERIDRSLRMPSLAWYSEPTVFEQSRSRLKTISFSESLKSEALQKTDMFPEVGVHLHSALRRSLLVLDSVAAVVVSQLPEPRTEDFYPKHGPGAVSDLKGGADKFQFPVWPRRLDHYFPVSYYSMYNEEAYRHYSAIEAETPREPMGRILAVPKTYKGPRLITAEPTALQYAQQGVLGWLRQHLPKPLGRCIDFRSQEPSRKAALKASLDGASATVDLSSASDRLSLWTVERVFKHSNILPYLYATRCLWVTDGTKIEGTLAGPLILRKYAGQGNATTFPVQSIVYSICCIAAVLTDRGWSPNGRNIMRAAGLVRVFGDDLIVPVSSVPTLDLILSFLQLKINASKTHMSGKFRESCGMDAYNGADVTPLYLSHLSPGSTVESQFSWLDVCNNAWAKGLWELSVWMEEGIPAKLRGLIPTSRETLQCISLRTFCPGSPEFRRRRFNERYQRDEGLGLIPLPKVRTAQREGSNGLTVYLNGQAVRTVHPLDYLAPLLARDPNSTIVSASSLFRRGWVALA